MRLEQLPVELVEEVLKHAFEARDPLPPFAGKYLQYRVMNEPQHGRPTLNFIRDVAVSLSQASSDRRKTIDFVGQLCQHLADNYQFNIANFWGDQMPEILDQTIEDSVYVAALLTKTTPLINKLVASGQMESVQSWLFGTARNYAAQYGDLVMMKAVMDSCLPQYILHLRRWMLQFSAEAGRMDIVQLVWNSAIDEHPWEFARGGKTCHAKTNESCLANMDTPSRDVFEFLMDKRRIHCTTRDYGDEKYTQFLSVCACKGWTEMAVHYLGLGAKVDGIPSPRGAFQDPTPLVKACTYGHEDVVDLLLAHGASVSKPTLEVAARSGSLSIVQKLLNYGAELEGALLAAAAKGWGDIVQELLDHGASIGSDLQPLLLSAVKHEHVLMFKLLVQRNGNVVDPVTMLECARVAVEQGLDSMAQLAIEVEYRNKSG
ncbi:ankyrin repeat-containing domain protein [Phaeosphaeria sp. MPI-PUGE-AT-0046c]|nr:ankyrin repeat-containing domain protein [Phaeosphaeria sp. MPI-PUGE-AT-0046c]